MVKCIWRVYFTFFCCFHFSGKAAGVEFSTSELAVIRSLSIANRPSLPVKPERVILGRALFHAKTISPSGRSCVDCHPNGGKTADIEPFRPPLMRRSPLLLDVAWNRWYFSDGRATSLESAILEPLMHVQEIGATPTTIRAALNNEPILEKMFSNAAGQRTIHRMGNSELLELAVVSLADYLRTVQSSPSRFDSFSSTVSTKSPIPLKDSEVRGLRIFIGKGNCITCHHGWRLSDGEFHNLRLLDSDGRVPTDPGRMGAISILKNKAMASNFHKFALTEVSSVIPYLQERGEQFGQFKTPGLRNLQDGIPLMHQGQFRSIRDVVVHYSEFSRSYPGHGAHDLLLQPLRLSSAEVDDLVEFLKTLQSESLP